MILDELTRRTRQSLDSQANLSNNGLSRRQLTHELSVIERLFGTQRIVGLCLSQKLADQQGITIACVHGRADAPGHRAQEGRCVLPADLRGTGEAN